MIAVVQRPGVHNTRIDVVDCELFACTKPGWFIPDTLASLSWSRKNDGKAFDLAEIRYGNQLRVGLV